MEEEKIKYVIRDGEKYDVKDFDPKYKDIMDQVDKEADEKIKKMGFKKPVFMGRCHLFWSEKQRILWEKYKIDWKSPSDLNPEILFD